MAVLAELLKEAFFMKLKLILGVGLVCICGILLGCEASTRTPSLDEFHNSTPRNQDAINKLEKGTTF